jgi:hypothetical protein
MSANNSSSAASGQPQVRCCPCGLPYEDVRDACKANRFICPAPWADGSEQICGRPLGAHPYERDINPMRPAPMPLAGKGLIILVDYCVLFHRNINSCCNILCVCVQSQIG